MMKAVTIDNFDIKIHERYAQDQQHLETKYITDSHLIPKHSEITGTSAIYSSQWEELFEIHLRNFSWASFCPPPKYHIQPKKFFSYRILPSIYVKDERDEENEQQQQEEKEGKNQQHEIFVRTLNAVRENGQNAQSFEKEKTILLNLLEGVRYLDSLLAHIHARKLQYQKG